MFEAVDVEVNGGVYRHEKVADVGGGLHPWRPGPLVLPGQARQLVQVGDPLDGVAQDEDEDDGQGDLGQGDLRLLRLGVRRGKVGGGGGGRALGLDKEGAQGKGVQAYEQAERPQAHEDKVHPDAVDLEYEDPNINFADKVCLSFLTLMYISLTLMAVGSMV